MEGHTIKINAGGGYEVHVAAGELTKCGEVLRGVTNAQTVAVVTDSNVAPLYLGAVRDSFENAGFAVVYTIIPAGEASKSMDTLSALLGFFAENGLTRADCAVALGGGVVGDLTGLAAGLYMRGIDLVQLPTTLLAAVDSSVGGKTAVDLPQGKNLVGLFVQPKAVICDTECLKTLAPQELANGAAEAVKTGILGDKALFELLERSGVAGNEAEIISRCVACKGSVVEKDEFDVGCRQLLNLGHTAGHAIEKLSGYSVSHGHAVAAGAAIIARAAAKQGLCTAYCAERIESALRQNGLPVTTEYSASQLSEAALSDKKRRGGTITLVVPRKIGLCTLEAVPTSCLESIFALGLEGLT